ncbi:Mini-ribonuclease 3 [Ohessyouella blattaphilus]|uniref:Mini-ribonuclease 3 n=1 Tax=Ohessyouella blattaphilus TaxID=2949333 RepID=A0ABT1EK85_9FIRM|nr:ribonuclease III domain-containing protein [Ohessyouella blattaphilus]MCP1110086.1 ribonuclease III [Ohessyouella blattaphilus]MCR8563480.1 ribonuclease III [Ohessyouella blattaphilus]
MEKEIEKELNVNEYSPLSLAFIGDSVYDLIIKTKIIRAGNKQVKKLHQDTSHLVNAAAQSTMMRTLQDLLSDEEREVFKRGRNTKSVSPAKNQSVTDYRRATGFEALVGYLYLQGKYERISELVEIGLASLMEKQKEK